MRRSTRRSTMGVSIHNSLDFDSRSSRVSTRRSSSIVPNFDESRNLVGNFTTKFSMSSFVKRVEELTNDQRTAIERVGFGNLLRIHQHTLRKNLLVEWIDRWDCDKQAFVLYGRELTITAMDAALILGLPAAGNPVNLSNEKPLSKLEKDYGATIGNRKISIVEIEQRLQSLGDLANEDFTRTFLLFIFLTLLFPSSNAKIDSRYLFLLEDLDEVPKYSWGTAVVEDLYNCLLKRKMEQIKSMEGCLLLLQIWSFEHIEIGRPNLLSNPMVFPRACRWESSRCNSPRHWFTTKFNELEGSQVTWELLPTEVELTIDIIRELLVEEEGEETLLTSTYTAISMTTKPPYKVRSLCRNSVEDEEIKGCTGRDDHDQQADISENSGLSSEKSLLVETGGQEVQSTYVTMGLPPKQSISHHAMGDKETGRGTRRSKPDILADIQEDSRQSTDVSAITDDFTECTSSFSLQQNQIAESSRGAKGERCTVTEKSESSAMMELKGEIDMLREENAKLREKSSDFEMLKDQLRKKSVDNDMLREENAELRKELADLKEDNKPSCGVTSTIDNIEKLINAYFDGVSDASEVDLLR